MTQIWTVTYRIKGNSKVFGTKCALMDNRTTMNDIPKMISIKRGVSEDQIELLTLMRDLSAEVNEN